MAGQMYTGALVAKIIVVARSSLIPFATFEIKLAEAGAIKIRSAILASFICPISDSSVKLNKSK